MKINNFSEFMNESDSKFYPDHICVKELEVHNICFIKKNAICQISINNKIIVIDYYKYFHNKSKQLGRTVLDKSYLEYFRKLTEEDYNKPEIKNVINDIISNDYNM